MLAEQSIAWIELVMTIDPPRPARIISGTTARTVWNTPVRLTSSMSCHSASLNSQVGRKPTMPALAQTMSMCPNVPIASATAASSCAWSRTSAMRDRTRRPVAATSASVSLRSSPVASGYGTESIDLHTSRRTTSAPSSARRTACARPWPRAAPVISATFPSTLPMGVTPSPANPELLVEQTAEAGLEFFECFRRHGVRVLRGDLVDGGDRRADAGQNGGIAERDRFLTRRGDHVVGQDLGCIGMNGIGEDRGVHGRAPHDVSEGRVDGGAGLLLALLVLHEGGGGDLTGGEGLRQRQRAGVDPRTLLRQLLEIALPS